MNNYIFNLVFNSIRYQKKKYLLLFIGIIISVILSNSILLIVKNIYENQINERIKTNGDYHISFIDVNKDLVEELKEDNNVDEENTSLLLLKTQNSLPEIKNLRCDLIHVNNIGFKNILSKLEIKEGRLPENNKEIVLEEWVARRNSLNIGNKLKFNINGEDIYYEIVGYYNNFKSSQYKEKTNIYTLLDNISERDWKQDKVLNIMFKLKNNIPIKDNIKKYESMVASDKIEVNEDAMKLESREFAFNETALISIVLIIPVMIVSIIMIINIFNISVTEKVKYFGMLKMLGAAKKDIKKIVLLEALLTGLIVFPIGIMLSIIIVKYIIPLFNISYIIGDKIRIYGECILFSGVVLIITMIISGYFPARRAAKLVPLDAVFQSRVNQENMLKSVFTKESKTINNIENINKKKNNIILEMAVKNIKRNKKKYRVTVLSIMLSVFLVVVYSSYFSMVRYIMDKQTKEEVMINTKIYKGTDTLKEVFEGIYNKVIDLGDVRNIYKTYNTIKVTSNVSNNISENTLIQIYDSNRLDSIDKDKYFIDKNRSINEVKNGDGILIYCKNAEESKNINYGSDVEIKTSDNSTETLKVRGILEFPPYNIKNEFDQTENVTKIDKVIIISENSAKKLFPSYLSLTSYDLIAKDNNNLREYQTNIMNIVSEIQGVNWVEYDDIRASIDSILNQVNIIIMIFLSFIIFIAFLNLLNIISTNIIMRRQEFGILKSIGLSSKNIKLMTYIEGMFCTVKGALYGSIISILFVYAVKKIIISKSNWSIPIWIYVFPVIFSIAAGYLATYIPMRKINKDSIVELINIEEC